MATSAGQVIYRPINTIVPTYKAAVYDELLGLILELEQPPGSRLVEADIAARFGVSKTPIREAFLLLEADGLVTLTKFQGATVTPLSFEEWFELIHLTDSLEQPNLGRVARTLDAAARRRLRAQVAALSKARRATDGRTYRDLLVDVHLELFARIGSPHLTRMIALITRLARRYECAFTHRFEDTWTLELEIVQARIEGLMGDDVAAVSAAVSDGHERLIAMIKDRLGDPEVSRFLTVPE